MKKENYTLQESMYCQVCNLYDTCEKSKTCSCSDFVTDTDIRIRKK